MTDEKSPADDARGADAGPDAEEHKRIWREGLVQEALDNRPELRALGGKADFAASRNRGHDQGFEDAARTLTPAQLRGFTALLERRISRYTREEMPRDLQAYLAEQALGYDEAGYLVGYVNGVGDFLEAYRRQAQRDEQP
jgi:hypothetical protein